MLHPNVQKYRCFCTTQTPSNVSSNMPGPRRCGGVRRDWIIENNFTNQPIRLLGPIHASCRRSAGGADVLLVEVPLVARAIPTAFGRTAGDFLMHPLHRRASAARATMTCRWLLLSLKSGRPGEDGDGLAEESRRIQPAAVIE